MFLEVLLGFPLVEGDSFDFNGDVNEFGEYFNLDTSGELALRGIESASHLLKFKDLYKRKLKFRLKLSIQSIHTIIVNIQPHL